MRLELGEEGGGVLVNPGMEGGGGGGGRGRL